MPDNNVHGLAGTIINKLRERSMRKIVNKYTANCAERFGLFGDVCVCMLIHTYGIIISARLRG